MAKNVEPAVTEMTEGQARRLEKKKAAEAANAQSKASQLFIKIGAIVALCVIVFAIGMIVAKNLGVTKQVTDYSQNLTKEGKIKGVNTSEYIKVFDVNNIEVSYWDIAANEEDVVKATQEITQEYFMADEDGNEYYPEFDDEFAENFLGMTADEYRQKIRDEREEENLTTYIQNLLVTGTELIQVPEKYFTTVKGIIKNNDVTNYNNYNNISYQYTGKLMYNSFSEYTGLNDDDYEATLDERAYQEVRVDLATQKIFEDAGMTITNDEYRNFVANFNDNVEEQYGKGYVMRSIMYQKVLDFLTEKATVVDNPYK